MLFLDGVYIDSTNGSRARFRWVKAPTSDELTQLTHTIAHRVARYLERQGLLVRDAGSNCREDPAVINKILTQLDEKAATALLPECRAPPATGLFD